MRTRGTRPLRPALIPALLLATLIGGCSLVDFAYHQLDWLMLRQVEGVVDLDGPQRAQLRRDIAALLDWHCRTQVPRYRAFLAGVQQDFARGPITPPQVADYSAELEGYWYALLERSTGGLGRLLGGLSEHQLAQLDRALRARNADTAREIRATSRRSASRDYARIAKRQIRRWLGPLNERQQRIVDAWGRDFEPLADLGLEYRRGLHRQLYGLLLRHRDDPLGLERALDGLIEQIRTAPPPAYRDRVEANKRRSIEMVAAVATEADAGQRRHLSDAIDSWRAELGRIRCD